MSMLRFRGSRKAFICCSIILIIFLFENIVENIYRPLSIENKLHTVSLKSIVKKKISFNKCTLYLILRTSQII